MARANYLYVVEDLRFRGGPLVFTVKHEALAYVERQRTDHTLPWDWKVRRVRVDGNGCADLGRSSASDDIRWYRPREAP